MWCAPVLGAIIEGVTEIRYKLMTPSASIWVAEKTKDDSRRYY